MGYDLSAERTIAVLPSKRHHSLEIIDIETVIEPGDLVETPESMAVGSRDGKRLLAPHNLEQPSGLSVSSRKIISLIGLTALMAVTVLLVIVAATRS
ncbi:hypothetical protein ACEXOS_014090 [Herbiconiux sp. P16]|uniref:hypothetical protein n=1 Tax=Herbiconiux wuyangfengii TaxID=3342794 RepID=UPI0035B8271E